MREDVELAIEETLEWRPRASALADMVAALEVRRETTLSELRSPISAEHKRLLTARVATVEEQIVALREELAITRFVEDSVRATVNRNVLLEEFDDE